MSDTKKKIQELHERWPNEYSTYCIIRTPDGRSLEFETDLHAVRAETIIKELAKQISEE